MSILRRGSTRRPIYRFKIKAQGVLISEQETGSSETKASKNPTGEAIGRLKKPPVQAVQTVQVVESFGSENPPDPQVLIAQEIIEDLEVAFEQFCKIAANLPTRCLQRDHNR